MLLLPIRFEPLRGLVRTKNKIEARKSLKFGHSLSHRLVFDFQVEMSYSDQSHPLASLSSAAAAAASALPLPILNPPERSSSQSSSPAQAYHPQSHGLESHNHAIQQYYSHGHHGTAAGGGGGIVNSPDSIPSPHVNSSITGGGGSASKATGRKRKASQGAPGGGGAKGEDDKDSGKKRQVVSCGECKVSFVLVGIDERFDIADNTYELVQRRKIKVRTLSFLQKQTKS